MIYLPKIMFDFLNLKFDTTTGNLTEAGKKG
jgi:hypothetical protein